MTPNSAPVVFLPRDKVLDEVLGQVGQRLTGLGIEVIRPLGLEAPQDELNAALARADVAMFTMRTPCTRDNLLAAPGLRGVVYPTIGVESLDLTAADEIGLIVGHGAMPENYLGVAEAAVMLILMRMYNPLASNDVAHGRRARPAPNAQSVWARMLKGRTLGMVGFGRIGRAVAERLAGWGVEILISDPFVDETSLPAGVRAVDFDSVMQRSDVVLVLVAITPETKNIINERALSLMKPDAHLINVSRGEAVDEEALTRCLRERRIGGAALDVTRTEPLPLDSELLHLDNCFVTPHMIGQTKDVFEAIVPTAVANIRAILCGDLPPYCKNPGTEGRWRERLERLPRLGALTPDHPKDQENAT